MGDPQSMAIQELERMLQGNPRAVYEYKYATSHNNANDFHLKNLIIKGDLARTEVYLRHGASPNPKTVSWKNQKGWKNDWFPMLWAVMSGEVEIVELLLQFGADVNAKGGLSVKVMLSSSSWTYECRRAHTALRAAVERRDVEMVQKLLSAGACPESYQHHYGSAKSRESRNVAIYCDIPVLYGAVTNGNVAIAELLLYKGAKPNLPKSYKLNYSYLTEAIRSESPAMVALLLQYGADPNFQVPRLGTTLLILAAKASKHALEMAKLLIQHGANLNAREIVHKKQDALAAAVVKNDLELVVLLLKHGAKPNSVHSDPLSAAATVDTPTEPSIEIVNLLIDRGAQVNGCDLNGIEHLFAAVQKQNSAVTEALLKRGAKPDIVHCDMTPLKQAVLLDQVEMIRLLLRYGASPTARVFAPSVISRGREICCSALELAQECSSSRKIVSILNGSESKEPEPTPADDEEKKRLQPLLSDVSTRESTMDSLDLIALCEDLMDTTEAPSRPEVERTVSRAVLCITWALCHQPGRNVYCEWELVAPDLDLFTAAGTSYQPVRREPMSGSVVIARGRTAASCGPTSSSKDSGSIVADWHKDGFKLSTGVTLDETANLKALMMAHGSQRCLRSCELLFKVKAESGMLGGSKIVGEAWLQLSHLDVGLAPGSTAKFVVQLECKKKRTGTLAFELTY